MTVISAWDVYLVMQLDAIAGAIALAGIIAVVGCVFCLVVMGPILDMDTDNAIWPSIRRGLKGCLAALAVTLTCIALLPSSKTAAAMIVLPALTSDAVVDTVAPEARELYELAKDALRSVSAKPEANPAPQPEK